MGSALAAPDGLEGLDLDLVAALQTAPRAGLQLIAEVLGVSVSTVSRRLARMRRERALRVVGQVPWSVSSDSNPCHVWIAARPGAAPAVAREIARMPEARFVAVTTGRADVYCILHPARRQDAAALLVDRVPAIADVVSTRSELGLRMYASGATWRLHRLDERQLSLLRAGCRHAATGAVSTANPDEYGVLALLQDDSRITAAEAARVLDISPSTAYRAIQSLLERGVVVPRVEIEPSLLGYPLEVVLSLLTSPGAVAETAEALAWRPSTRYVSTVAGRSSIIHQGLFRGEDDLADFLTVDLAGLPGVTAFEVSVVARVLTRYWSPRESA
ncbi:MAG: Lrp/AsnC family transcriptional regulator [Nocardioidaceae bacterium]